MTDSRSYAAPFEKGGRWANVEFGNHGFSGLVSDIGVLLEVGRAAEEALLLLEGVTDNGFDYGDIAAVRHHLRAALKGKST